jgi:hypothetical protein
MREAYPNPTTTGQPKYYAIFGPSLLTLTSCRLFLGPHQTLTTTLSCTITTTQSLLLLPDLMAWG